MHVRWLEPTLTLTLLGAACQPAFDDPSEVISLRVLGVRKDEPFPKPGATVNLSMLWHDGRPDSAVSGRAPVQVQLRAQVVLAPVAVALKVPQPVPLAAARTKVRSSTPKSSTKTNGKSHGIPVTAV